MRRVECDAPGCPARAVGLIRLATGHLALCGHHCREYRPHLEPLMVEVVPLSEVPDTPPPVEEPGRHPYRDAVEGMRDN